MKKLIVFILSLYFLVTPVEFILNHLLGGSAKYLGGVSIGLIIIYLLSSRKKFSVRFHHILIILWVFYGLLTLMWADFNEFTVQYFSTYLSMVTFFVFSTSIRYTESEYNKILTFALIGTLIISLLLVFQQESYYSGSIVARKTVNLFGVKQDPNNIAATILVGVAISLDRILRHKTRMKSRLLILIILITAIILTGSRGGFLSLLILIFIFLLMAHKSYDVQRIKISSRAGLLMIAVISLGVVLVFIPDTLVNRIFDISSYASGSGRTELWNLAWNGIKNNILFGNGIASQANYYLSYFGYAKGIHNTFLMVLFETGILGLSLFLASFLIILRKNLRKKNVMEASLLVATMITSFFLDVLIARFLWNAVILSAISIDVQRNIVGEKPDENSYNI